MEYRDKDMINGVYGSEYGDSPEYEESSSKRALKLSVAFWPLSGLSKLAFCVILALFLVLLYGGLFNLRLGNLALAGLPLGFGWFLHLNQKATIIISFLVYSIQEIDGSRMGEGGLKL